ncbi:MAG: protein kinase domain-containing protein, partial [Thermoanaerobaculia bacterium]
MTSEVAAGTTFGPYVIDSMIGSGGMGAVYRASDPRLRRDVAIKIIQPQFCDSEERRRRFETEARSAARLAHPNVVSIYDVGEQNGTPYIVTEFVEGGTLTDQVRRRAMSFDETLPVAVAIAEALAEAHQRGIVHRDLKPDNILLTTAGVPKISDFGLAKCLEPETSSDWNNAPTVAGANTREGTIIGTPAYMSPEQASGRPVDFRSDIFSFGAILIEMVTGRRPFQRSSHVQTLAAVLEQDPDYAPLERSMPPGFVAIVRRCLRKDPRERYGSTTDLVHDLKQLTQPATPKSKPRPWIIAGSVIAAIVILAVALALFRSRPSAKIESLAILPLQNFSPDRSQDYFADAMTEELTAELASLRSLRVTSRTSASAFRGTTKPLTDVARELNVDALIEGSVIRSGDRA